MKSTKPFWSRDIGLWAAYVALALIYAFDFALIVESGRLDKSATTGTIAWTAILFAFAWRKLGRSGWLGFFVGLAFGILAIPVLLFLVSAYRSMV